MPGWELYGHDEREALNDLFQFQNGIMFAHGFDKQRRGRYQVREFEDLFATRMGVAHAQAVSSGSAAVKIALQAAGVKAGDEVITSCFTFCATVEAILECNAVPVLVDVDETLNMDHSALVNAVSAKTKALLPVHMMGECCEMAALLPTGLPVVEDACQALGASYSGKQAGTLGTLGAYSFDGGKTLTCGEGGMVVTNDEHLWREARAYHDHGHNYRSDLPRGRDEGRRRGFNYRMTEMQAAVGIAQLRKLDFIIMKQRKNKAVLVKTLGDDFFKRFPMRVGADPKGDAGDTLVFFCDTREQADKFSNGMAKSGLATKNLPDALDWHFAGRWPAYLRDEIRPGNNWQTSSGLLFRAVALPIMVNWAAGDIETLADSLKNIARGCK